MDEMPLSRVNMHLVRQWAKNPSLPSTESTLNDWGYLGAAVQYADIVVTEKLFADIVHREGFRPRARIITDLEELPAVLLDSLGYAGSNEWPQLEA